LHDRNFNRFRLIHPRDGLTDGRAIAYTALCIMLSSCRALKIVKKQRYYMHRCTKISL